MFCIYIGIVDVNLTDIYSETFLPGITYNYFQTFMTYSGIDIIANKRYQNPYLFRFLFT